MDDRTTHIRVGVVVVATLIIAALLIGLNSSAPFAWLPWGQQTYRVEIGLEQAPGVGPNTPVRRNGILIGRVAEVQNLPDMALVVASIHNGQQIPISDICRVRTTVLGDATVDFVPGQVPSSDEFLQPGQRITGQVAENPLDLLANMQSDVSQAVDALTRAGDSVSQLADRVNQAFGQEQPNLEPLFQRVDVALEEFTVGMRSINALVGDEGFRTDFRQGFADMPEAVEEIRLAAQEGRTLMQELGGTVDLANENLTYLRGVTEPLGRNGEEIASAITGAAEGIDVMLEQLSVLTRAVSEGEGTLGKLIRDDELYNNLNTLLQRADLFVYRLDQMRSKRLEPILDDIRAFTFKIALEPGRLIGGAFGSGSWVK